MKRIVLATLFMLVTAQLSFAATTQVDSLIEILVEKNIITRTEGIKLKGEIASDEKMLREDALKVSLPEWVQKLKLKGDFRARYQWEKNQHSQEANSRWRIRYRLGLDTKVNDTVTVGAGFSSGATDPRSTNQTLENTFERPDLRLDYAYAEWEPMPKNKVAGGKLPMKDYLWTPTDLLWDSDINPTGASVHLEHNLTSAFNGYLNVNNWVLDNNGAVDMMDPYMSALQAGLKWKDDNAGLNANLAGTYYGFHSVKGVDLDNERNTNSQTGGVADSTLRYDYDAVGASAEFGIDTPLKMVGFDQVEHVAFFGDYIHNLDSGDNNSQNEIDDGFGWALGARIGHKKVANKGHWQAKYIYATLHKDAWLDVFPDSDRKGGDTDVRSHEYILEYGLSKNVSVGLDYYQTSRMRATEATEHLLQADMNFKF